MNGKDLLNGPERKIARPPHIPETTERDGDIARANSEFAEIDKSRDTQQRRLGDLLADFKTFRIASAIGRRIL